MDKNIPRVSARFDGCGSQPPTRSLDGTLASAGGLREQTRVLSDSTVESEKETEVL